MHIADRMIERDVVRMWQFPASAEYGWMAWVARNSRTTGDARVAVIACHGDAITVQILGGALVADRTARFYVEGWGGFELAREERWRGMTNGCTQAVLLNLRAWPRREDARVSSPRLALDGT